MMTGGRNLGEQQTVFRCRHFSDLKLENGGCVGVCIRDVSICSLWLENIEFIFIYMYGHFYDDWWLAFFEDVVHSEGHFLPILLYENVS